MLLCYLCWSWVHFWKSAKNLVWCLLYHSQQPLDVVQYVWSTQRKKRIYHLLDYNQCNTAASGCINHILFAHQGVFSRATFKSAFIPCYTIWLLRCNFIHERKVQHLSQGFKPFLFFVCAENLKTFVVDIAINKYDIHLDPHLHYSMPIRDACLLWTLKLNSRHEWRQLTPYSWCQGQVILQKRLYKDDAKVKN